MWSVFPCVCVCIRTYTYICKYLRLCGIPDISPYHILICITAPSDIPEFVYVMDAGPYGLNVTWTQPPIIHHNSPLTGYKITYNLDGGNEIDIDIADTTSLFYVIDDLIPYMAYGVKVAALNDVGIGPFSDLFNTYTNKTRKFLQMVHPVSISIWQDISWDTQSSPFTVPVHVTTYVHIYICIILL